MIRKLAASSITAGMALLLFSCKSNPTSPVTVINSITDANPLILHPMNGDTVVIAGSGFGNAGDGGSVVFTPSVTVPAANCPEWTSSEIRVLIPQNAVAGNVVVKVNGNSSNAVNLDILFPHYTIADGLADTNVTSLAVDTHDNVWAGTANGVSKFNGSQWTTYSTQSGLPGNYAMCLAVDKQGNVWAGMSGGAAKFDGTQWTAYTTADGLPDNTVNAIAFDAAGNAWFGTNNGVAKFDGAQWTVYRYVDSLTHPLPDNVIRSLVFDKSGRLWLGTENWGAVKMLSDTAFLDYEHDFWLWRLISAAVDSQGALWFGTWTNGVAEFKDSTWSTYNKSSTGIGLADYTVTTIAVDRNNVKWFGTYNGVSRFDGATWSLPYTTDNGLVNNKVQALVFDRKGYLWVGTNGGGLSRFNFQ